MAGWTEYTTEFQKVTWNVGMTLDSTNKFPLIAKRIWRTKADLLNWVKDDDSTACVGLVCSVVEDPTAANNGVYFINATGSTNGAIEKIGDGAQKISNSYTEIDYPDSLKNAKNVNEGDTLDDVAKKVETTISALTQHVIDKEEVNATTYSSIGLNEYGDLEFTTTTPYIGDKTVMREAVETLATTVKTLSGNTTISNDYTEITYPLTLEGETFDGAQIVKKGDTLDQVASKVETTISALTQNVLDYELVNAKIYSTTYSSIGLNEYGDLEFTTTTPYISNKTVMKDAVETLADEVYSRYNELNEKIENLPNNGEEFSKDNMTVWYENGIELKPEFIDGTIGSSNVRPKATNCIIGKKVTSIDNNAFASHPTITSVTLPDSVTSIGSGAFKGCTKLTRITLTSGVTSIGNYAFSGCNSISTAEIEKTRITTINEGLFYSCDKIKNVIIPYGVTSIGDSAFYWSGLASIEIPYSVKSIGDNAFNGCYNLTSIEIPDDVTRISNAMFVGCSSLTSVTIPNKLTSIGNRAFESCESLTSVTIPNRVTSIGSNAFRACRKITSLVINGDVNTIDDGTFSGCASLSSVTIPNSVTSIGNDAFSGCKNLSSVTIPNSVTSISYKAFSGCSSLSSVTIPTSVTSIGYSAFGDCTSLTSVTIPNSVTTISTYAFSGCSSLSSVIIPTSVTSIEAWAFGGCINLNKIIFDGTESVWNAINKGMGYVDKSITRVVVCSDGIFDL